MRELLAISPPCNNDGLPDSGRENRARLERIVILSEVEGSLKEPRITPP